jgi:hypothetical protein
MIHVTHPGGWHTVWLTPDLSHPPGLVREVADRVAGHLAHVPGRPYKVTTGNPLTRSTGWNLAPWHVVQVYLCEGFLGWWPGDPAGLAPVSWHGRKARGLQTVPVYVGSQPWENRRAAQIAVRACHELYHCYTGDHAHTDHPGNIMYGGGVRPDAGFHAGQLAALAAVPTF